MFFNIVFHSRCCGKISMQLTIYKTNQANHIFFCCFSSVSVSEPHGKIAQMTMNIRTYSYYIGSRNSKGAAHWQASDTTWTWASAAAAQRAVSGQTPSVSNLNLYIPQPEEQAQSMKNKTENAHLLLLHFVRLWIAQITMNVRAHSYYMSSSWLQHMVSKNVNQCTWSIFFNVPKFHKLSVISQVASIKVSVMEKTKNSRKSASRTVYYRLYQLISPYAISKCNYRPCLPDGRWTGFMEKLAPKKFMTARSMLSSDIVCPSGDSCRYLRLMAHEPVEILEVKTDASTRMVNDIQKGWRSRCAESSFGKFSRFFRRCVTRSRVTPMRRWRIGRHAHPEHT